MNDPVFAPLLGLPESALRQIAENPRVNRFQRDAAAKIMHERGWANPQGSTAYEDSRPTGESLNIPIPPAVPNQAFGLPDTKNG